MRGLMRRLLSLGVADDAEPRAVRHVLVTNGVLLFCFLTNVILMPVWLAIGDARRTQTSSGLLVAYAAVLVMSSRGSHRLARMLLVLVSAVGIILGGLFLGPGSVVQVFIIGAAAAVWFIWPEDETVLAWATAGLAVAAWLTLALLDARGALWSASAVRMITEAAALLLSLACGYYAHRRALEAEAATEAERRRADALLCNMLPASIAERLKNEHGAIADSFDSVSVLFADIVGFTPLSARMDPTDLVGLLNRVFSEFDELVRRRGLEKIKTIGDAYMVVGGAPSPRTDHAEAMVSLALELRQAVARFDGLGLRIGVHTGPAVAGVIGTAKYSYDLWGDTVNTASRMESHGAAGEIHVSDACRAAVGDRFQLVERGVIDVKGKGPMRTWWVRGAL